LKSYRPATLPHIVVLQPRVFGDNRGHFFETFHVERYAQHGIATAFVQDNVSCSVKGVLRGLHYQVRHAQAKLVWVVTGEVFDVAVDIRRGSPTFGKWFGFTLSAKDYTQLYIPEGFAHGFCVMSDTAVFLYKCSDYYAPKEERGIRWDDPSLAIEWPVTEPVLSEKDAAYPALNEIPVDDLPVFEEKHDA
jgi:dTDP-4-dehydrorhamnose 3,5-epimerase